MKFKLGEFKKIPLYLHWSLIPFILVVYFLAGLIGIGIWIIALISITLHEYGHCFAALRCGQNVRDITLSPLGGRAVLQFDQHDPNKELYVTIAGPIVNLVLVAMFTPLFLLGVYLNNVPIFVVCFMTAFINLLLMCFNLLPIFPMDGGRILRALLSYKFGHKNATVFSVKFGQVLAICLIPVAFYSSAYIAVIVLVVICFIAQKELGEARLYDNVITIRSLLAKDLNNPKINTMTLSELILVLERLDKNDKERLDAPVLVELFTEFQRSESV